jgi:MFS family permease
MSLGAVGLVPTLAVGYLPAPLMGAAASMFLSACAGSLQLLTDNALRGRVTALYTMGFLGTAPLGGPATGYVAQVLDPRVALLLGAGTSIVAALLGPGKGETKSDENRRTDC